MGKVDAWRWSASEKTLRRQVLVHIWPVDDKSATDHSEVLSLSFGGMKQSGFGRELGLEALDSYSDVKNVFVSTDG